MQAILRHGHFRAVKHGWFVHIIPHEEVFGGPLGAQTLAVAV